MIEFILNNQHIITDKSPSMVLLDFIRKEKRLAGTKEGCREGDCGACTILIGELIKSTLNYKSINSCLMPLQDAHGKHIVTVEGLNQIDLSPIQKAMVEEGGTQCGFCTPGFVISLTGYFLNAIKPDIDSAVNSLGGNICRCTGYNGIVRAVEKSINAFEAAPQNLKQVDRLIASNFIPAYFKTVVKDVKAIKSIPSKTKLASYFVSGGTDLYVQQWENIVQSKAYFASSANIPNQIVKTSNQIKIGGASTIQQVLESKIIQKHFPSLQKQLELFGSLPIRNRATVAGNIVNASPIGDLTNILIALDAELHLAGSKKRSIFLRDFYKGYKTVDLKKGERVEWVTFPIPPKKLFFNFEKVSKRTYLDIASVNSTIAFTMSKNKITCVGLSAGGVAPIPLFLQRTCEFLCGSEVNMETILNAVEIAMSEISPISDARGSAEYKRLLLRQLIFAHFIMLFPNQINESSFAVNKENAK